MNRDEANQVRETVAKAYTEALKRSQANTGGCCCAPKPTVPKAIPKKTDSCCAPKPAVTEVAAEKTGSCCAPKPAVTEVAAEKTGSCCAPTSTGESTTASVTGYGVEKETYSDAAASSFGCGNPLAFSEVQPGQTVVDLGSGAGFDLLIAAEKVGPEGVVIGIDMTDAMIEAARDAATKAGHANIDVRKGLIEELPVDSGTVDHVISNCVINLSPDKPRVFAEIARVLVPGGRFSISDIVVEDLPDWLRQIPAAYSACVAGAISEADYLAGLRDAGLVDVQVRERLVYDADQLRALLANELASLEIPEELVAAALDAAAGKVWSAKLVGRKA